MFEHVIRNPFDMKPVFNPCKKPSFNVNERVFNMVIKNHIEEIECISWLKVFWDKPWGYNVTMRIDSSEFQYKFIG